MIRVLIADDHVLLRDGVRAMLEAQVDIEVVGQASDGEETLARAAELRPDIVIMDIPCLAWTASRRRAGS